MSGNLQNSTDSRGCATLTLARPDVHNAFNAELIAELTGALAELDADEAVRVVVLTGSGASFCAGADVHWMRSMASASKKENREDAIQLASLMRKLNFMSKPTVARVNGAALGGGVGLLACCDSVIASDNARFGLTEARLGLVPAVIAPYVLRKIGESGARHLFISGSIIDAHTALNMGLVHQVVAADALDTAVEKHVANVLKTGPASNLFSRHLISSITGNDLKKQEKLDEITADLIAELRVSDEGQEGLSAFLEKRPPGWVKDQ